MFRSIRRFLVLAIAFASGLPGAAGAGFLSSLAVNTSNLVLTPKTCPAVTPVIHELRVIGVPSAEPGNSCTNDLQCTGAGEACTFALGATTGTCSASGLLTRSDIHYVAGNLIDVEVTIPECTGVSTVQGVTLLGGSGFDGQSAPVSWSFLPSGPPTTVNGQPAIRQRLRIQFSNYGYGDTGSMPIEVMARTGGSTTTRSLTIAGVAAVNAAMRTTVAETRIRNSFVTSIYRKFGDYEQFYNEAGQLKAYDVDWSELTPTFRGGALHYVGTDMRIGTDQITFASSFKGNADGCNPDVNVDGWFRLVPDGDSVRLEWIQAPLASVGGGGVCSLVTLGLYELVIDGFADEDEIAAPFAKTIAAGFGADEDGRIKICDGCKVVDVKIGNGKVEIWTAPPSNRIRVTVSTTRGTDVTANPSQGLLLPAGFYAPIMGGGSFDTCVAENGVPASCDKLTVDMDGAFNWWGNDVPVPDSIVYDPVYGAYVLGGRANARERLRGVTRHAALLPAPTFPADTLIARRSQISAYFPTSRARISNGCVLPPIATSAYRMAFGVNDLWNSPPTSGKLQATVLIADNKDTSAILFGSSKACAAEPVTGGATLPTTRTSSTLAR